MLLQGTTDMLQKAGMLMVILSAGMMGACSRQAWYEGGKESARQTCYRKADNEAVQRCLEEINRLPYELLPTNLDGSFRKSR